MKNQLHNLVRLAVCAATIFTANASKATIVYTSNKDGNWVNTPSNWDQNGSSGLNKYVIRAQDTITLNSTITGVDTLWVSGTLVFGSNRDITINSGGTIILDWGGKIMGGSGNSEIIFTGSSYRIGGPFTAANGNLITDGPRWATASSTTAALGDPQGSFVGLSLLPVQLSSIQVEKMGNAYQLSWTALGNSNQNTFTVEVSKDGRTFEFAGTIAGNRELVEGEYEFNIYGMKSSFYVRLSETDANGTKTALATKYVKNIATTVDAFQIYPTLITPAGQSINMVLPVSGTHKVAVYTMDMQVAAETTATTYSDNELVAFNSGNWNLNAGYYVVVVTSSNGEIHKTRIMVR